MRIEYKFSAVLALVIIVIFTHCSDFQKNKKDSGKAKYAAGIPVNGVVVNPQELENKISVVGTILPNERVDLKSEASGRVTGLYFKEGSRVNKGQLLMKIYDADLLAQLKKIKVQQALANREEERKRQLLAIGGISQQEYDLAKNQSDALNADAELIQAQIRKTEVLAPFSGVIGLRNISEGEIVSSATQIASLQQIDPIKVEFDIPEKYSAMINPGAIIDFTITGSEKVFQGKVYATEPMIDVITRTLKVRALCDNKAQILKPGAFIKIELMLGKNKNALMVPTEAVVPGLKEQKVFLYRKGVAVPKIIKTGIRNESSVQVTDGLSSSDTVIISGLMQLKDSARVSIKIKN